MTRLLTAAALGLALWQVTVPQPSRVTKTPWIWDDATGALPLTCKSASAGNDWDCRMQKSDTDVPAIQLTRLVSENDDPVIRWQCRIAKKWNDSPMAKKTIKECSEQELYWACADGDRILEESFNHKRHTCRRIQP